MKKIDTFKAVTTGLKAFAVVVCMMLLFVGNLRADEFTYIFSEQGFENATELTTGSICPNINYSASSGSSSNTPKYYTSGTALRMYANNADGMGNMFTLIPTGGITITSLEISAASSNYTPLVKYMVDGGNAIDVNADTDNVYVISNVSATTGLAFYNAVSGASTQLRITQIKITYELGTPTAATPQFTPSAGTFYEATNVAINCATEGAEIYYTTDGTTPDNTSAIYSGAITVNANTIIKAIAYADNMDASPVATATYTFPTLLDNVAAFQTAATGVTYKIENVTFVYRNGRYMYVQDATGGLLIYDSYNPIITTEYESGDVIPAIYGTLSVYNGLTEMVPTHETEAATSNTGAVTPTVVTLADIAANYSQYESMFIKVIGVTCAANTYNTGSASNMNVTQDNTTLALRSNFKNIALDVPANYEANFAGFVATYNTTIQLYLPEEEYFTPSTLNMPATIDFETPMSMVLVNGTQTNKWFLGQAQGFDNNKLYISSTNGATNKYNVTAASVVHATREVVIPANGAILSFDYKVVGEAADYLQVAIVDAGTELTAGTNVADYIVRLYNQPQFTQYTYNVPATLAGNKVLVFTWVNNSSNGTQTPAAVDNISLIESSCVMPTNLVVTTNEDAATVVWTAPADQTAWILEYKLTDHSEWYSMNISGTPTASIINLQGNSSYNIRVKAVCGDMESAWNEGTFNVECLTLTTIEDELTIGTGTSTGNYLFPGFYGWQYTAVLYDMTQYGNINSISYYLNASSSSSGSSMQVWVKAVDADYALATSNTFATMLDGAQQIYDGSPDFSTAGWIEFPISGGFNLPDGEDLLVLVRGVGCNTSGGCSKYARYTSATNKCWFKRQDRSDPGQTVTGSISDYRYNIQIDMEIVSCGDVVSCVAPTDVTISNLTASSADVAWVAGANETAWLLEYKLAADLAWTSVQLTDANYTITGLNRLSNYQVRVRAICDEMDESEPTSAVSFTTLATCFAPTNISHSNSSTTTILSWVPGGIEEHYVVQFKQLAQSDDQFVSIPVDFSTTTAFGGLTPNTQYIARIKSVCDEVTNDESDWVNYPFISGCAPVDITFEEDFTASSVPDCWTNNGFMFQSGIAVASSTGNMLVTPALNIPANGTTYIKYNVGTNVQQANYQVALSFRGTAADNFTTIYSGVTAGTMSEPENVQIEIPQSYNGQPIYIAFVSNGYDFIGFDNLVVTQCPAIPSNLVSSNVTPTSVDLAWTVDASATNFVIEYSVDGDSWTVVNTTTNSYTFDNLTPETSYQIRVFTACGENNMSLYSNTITVNTPAICPQPTGLAVSNISGQSADLSWTAGANETAWNIEYGPAGFEQGTGTTIAVSTNTYTLTGLYAVTEYDVYLQADCGTTDGTSNWQSTNFTTTCDGVFSLPYFENFDNYSSSTSMSSSTIPNCWERDFTGTSTSYNVGIYPSSNYSHSGNNSLKFYNYCSSSNQSSATYGDIYAVMPMFDAANPNMLQIEFYAAKYSTSSSYNSEIVIGVATDPSDLEGTFVPVVTVSPTTTYSSYEYYMTNLSSYTGENGYITFYMQRPTGSPAYNYVYIDDLTIDVIPTCPKPTALAVTNNSETQIDFSWTAGGSENAWNIQYGVSGFELGTGLTQTVNTNSSSITGLVALASYDIYVQANCGDGDLSQWVGPITGVAASVYSMPTTGTSTITTCDMTIYDDGGVNGNYSSNCDATLTINPSTAGAKVQINGSFATESCCDELIIYDGSSTSGTVLFTSDGSSSGTISVISTTGPLTVYFSSDGSVQYSGFELQVSCVLPLACADPTNLTFSNVTSNSADLSWTAGGSETAWNIEYGPAGFEQGTGTPVAVTTNSYSLTGLSAATQYDVYLQADCGVDNGTSYWIGTDFTTECGAVVLPFLETFESNSGSAQCWQIIDNNEDGGEWEIYNSNAYQGSYAARIYTDYNNGDNDDYLITPAIPLTGNQYLSYYYRAHNSSEPNDVEILLSTTGTQPSDFTTTLMSLTSISNTTYAENIIDLSNYSGTVYIAFHVPFGGLDGWYLYIDEVSVNSYATCPAPTDVVVSNVATGTADVTWTIGGSETAWNIEYGPAGFELGTGTVVHATTNPYTLTGLSNSILYDVYVQADCENNDLSTWTLPATFAAACGNTTVPYFENFDNYSSTTTVSSSTIPNCWERDFTGTSTSYNAGIYPSTTYSYSGNNSLRFYNYCSSSSQTSAVYGDIYAVLPMMDVANPNMLQIEFYAAKYSTSYNSQIVIGVATDLSDLEGTFVPVVTVSPTTTYSSYEYYVANLTSYTGENGYITIFMQRPTGSPAYNYVYIDDLTVDYADPDMALTNLEIAPYLCDFAGQEVAITVKNLNPFADITTFDASYVINDGTPVTETVTLTTPLAFTESYTYTFTSIPTYTSVNSLVAWIDYAIDEISANDTLRASTNQLTPNTVPFTENFSNVVVNQGWNQVDANNDGIMMEVENGKITYSYNDELAANDWLISPCFDLTAGKYEIAYDYNALSLLQEGFAVYYGTAANASSMTNLVATHTNFVQMENVLNGKTIITIPQDGIYNFGIQAQSLAGNMGFTIDNFSITPVVDLLVTYGDNGLITPNGLVEVNYNETQLFSIYPNDGYHIKGIYVNDVLVRDEDMQNARFELFTYGPVTEPATIHVDFEISQYYINATVANNDIYTDYNNNAIGATFAPVPDTIMFGDPYTGILTLDPNFHLYSAISNGNDVMSQMVQIDDNNYSITFDRVMENKDLAFVVEIDTIAVVYTIEGGQGYCDASALLIENDVYSTWVNYNYDLISNIVPAVGYHIESVTVNGLYLGAISNYSFDNIVETQYVNVVFAKNTYTITTTAVGNGTITDGITLEYDPAFVYNYDVTPATGYSIASLEINGVAVDITNPEVTYTSSIASITQDYTIIATFQPLTYTIDATAEVGGTITPSGELLYNYGANQTFSIVPNEGYQIADLVVDGVSQGALASYTFNNVTANHTINATFEINTYSITATAGVGGTITPNGVTNVNFGGEQVYTIAASEGYYIENVVVDNVTLGPISTYTFANVEANHTISATFVQYEYTIVSSINGNGTITPEGTTTVAYDGTQAYTIAAATGYHILDVLVDGVSQGVITSYTFNNVVANHTIAAVTAVDEYTVTVNQPANGAITPAGTHTVNYGATPSFTVTPADGYVINTITVAGQAVAFTANAFGVATITLPAVTADVTVSATMTQLTYTITATAGANGTITPAGVTTLAYGANQSYTITPAAGYLIASVSVDGIAIGNVASFTFTNVMENHTIAATFEIIECVAPINTYISNLDETSVTLNWNNTGAATYSVHYKAISDANYTEINNIAATSVDLTGLQKGTNYIWNVRSNCSSTNTSGWSYERNFTTPDYTVVVDTTVIGITENALSNVQVYSHVNNVFIVNNEGVDIENVAIYDMYGKLVYSGNIVSNPTVISLNVATGIYMVKLETEFGVSTRKVHITK